MKSFWLFLALLLFTCCSRISFFSLPKETVVCIFNENSRKEIFINEYITQNKFNMFLLIEGDCNACLAELGWWFSFIKKHRDLSPIFIINTKRNDFLNFVISSDLNKYPIIFDTDYKLLIYNNIKPKDLVIVTNNNLEILYKGDPLNDKKFSRLYNNLSLTKH